MNSRTTAAFYFLIFLTFSGKSTVFAQNAGGLNSIPPFSWKDSPDVVLSHLSDLNVEFINGGNSGDPIEAKNVPFLGYLGTIRAEFLGFNLKSLTFRIEASGPQEALFFIYNDINTQLKNAYGQPLSMNLLSRESVWRSPDRNRALWYQMIIQKAEQDKIEGTLQGSIALRGTTTGEGRQSSNNALLDVNGVKFSLNTAASINYKMILQITFQNLTPGQTSSGENKTVQTSSDAVKESSPEEDKVSQNSEINQESE